MGDANPEASQASAAGCLVLRELGVLDQLAEVVRGKSLTVALDLLVTSGDGIELFDCFFRSGHAEP